MGLVKPNIKQNETGFFESTKLPGRFIKKIKKKDKLE